MPARLRNALLAALALLAVAAVAGGLALLRLHPRLERTPEAIARGRAFVQARCLHCHATIALAPRVAGWSPRRAYDTLGDLPAVNPAMPRFPGSEAERCAVSSYLSALGAGEASPP